MFRLERSFRNWGNPRLALYWQREPARLARGWFKVLTAGWPALSSGPPLQSHIQSSRKEGNHLLRQYIDLQTLDTDLPFSWCCGNKSWLVFLGAQIFIPPLEGGAGPSLHPAVLVWPSESSPCPQCFTFKLQHWLWPGEVCQEGSQLSLGAEPG